jgi:RND family efflux transporter MFP subunit
MPADKVTTPNRHLLLLSAAVALVTAGAVATSGIFSRADANRQLVQWTNQHAIPAVQLAKLDQGSGTQVLTLPGNVQPFNKAALYARVSGYLGSWKHDIGAHVKATDMLASIDTPDLDQQFSQAQADLATATANAQLAAVTAQRWSTLVKSQWVSRQAADDKTGAAAATKATMDASAANLKRLAAMESFKSIVAPFDGVVTERNTDVGTLINAGSSTGPALFEVSDLHKVRIYVQVPQAFSGQLHPGLKATLEMPQYPGQPFDAVLVSMSHAMNPTSRSMLVQLQADNPEGKFSAGAYCQVHFQLPTEPNVVRVPATALVPGNQGMEVAVLGADNKVQLKPVEIGRDFGDSAEVVAGLSSADRVIDSPPETLQSGDQVQLVSTESSSQHVATR